MMFPRLALLAAVLGVASADLQITNPDANHWWVANSTNTLAWTCSDTSHPQFTVLFANSDPKILPQPQAIIAIQNNFDCSKTIDPTQSNLAIGSGWTVLFADILNSTNILVTSQPFEVKAFGSAYPTSVSSAPSSTSGGSGSTSPSATAGTQGGSQQSGNAMGLKATFSGVFAAAAAVVGYALA